MVSRRENSGQRFINGYGGDLGYVVLQAPAGITNFFTVESANPNFGFDTVVSNLTLQIVDNNTSNVLSGQTNTVIVGQQMNFQCQLNDTNAGLMNSMLSNIQWTVPGDTISSFTYSNSSSLVITNFATNNATVEYYWVDGATNFTLASNTIVQCSATINGATITGQAVFNVLKPIAKITPVTTSVNINNNALNFDTDTSPGIKFPNTMTIPDGFSGTNFWIQVCYFIVDQLQSNLVTYTRIENGPGPYGDTPIPYQVLLPVFGPTDSPFIGLPDGPEYIKAVAKGRFEMWMMFQPTNGMGSSINGMAVPLRAVKWFWGGVATNGASGWKIASATNSVNPEDFDTETYPIWKSAVTNFQWKTNL